MTGHVPHSNQFPDSFSWLARKNHAHLCGVTKKYSAEESNEYWLLSRSENIRLRVVSTWHQYRLVTTTQLLIVCVYRLSVQVITNMISVFKYLTNELRFNEPCPRRDNSKPSQTDIFRA